MIPKETIDRIYASARIEDVISDYVTLRKRGANLIGLCPFHEEKTGSFTVSPAKGIFKCFGCGKAGNAVNFVMEYEQCTYVEALRTLARKYRIEIQEREQSDEERQAQTEREAMFMLNEWANEWFQHNLWNTDEGRNIGLKYFLERGIREDIIRKFHLGYSPEKNALYAAAHDAKFSDKLLENTGLCGKSSYNYYDRFRGRVIFPIYTISGKTVAFAGRILKQQEHVGKYVNSPDSLLYSKQNELYGLSLAKQAITKQGTCYLVEGQMDVISMHQAGIENVVSSGGTALTKHQILLLHRFTDHVTVLYDGDAAGIHAALRGIDMLLEQGINVKVVLLPDGEDPDSFARKQNAADFIQFIKSNQQDFIRFKTNLLLQDSEHGTIERSAVIKDIVRSISVIPERIKRELYAKDCSELSGIPVESIRDDIRDMRSKAEIDRKKRSQYAQRSNDNLPKQNTPSADNTFSSDSRQGVDSTATDNTPTYQQPASLKPSALIDNKLDENIRNLLQVLVRYGGKILYTDDEGTGITVGQYVLTDLDTDRIEFDNPIYSKVINELRLHLNEPDFCAETFFRNHSDPQVSSLASNLISDKYTLSKIHSKKNISENVSVDVELSTEEDELENLVPHLLYELKLALVNKQLNALRSLLQHAQENNDEEMMLQLLQQQPLLEQVRRALCDALGHRVQ